MRIAQVAPLAESVPPRFYGGTERVVSYLTEELVARGHDVTLFASGDSSTRARLVSCAREAYRLNGHVRDDAIAAEVAMIERVFRAADRFDVIHAHLDYLHLPLARGLGTPVVTTLHGRLDGAGAVQALRAFADLPLVSISDAQRAPVPEAGFVATVPHGIPRDLLRATLRPGRYLAFLGRLAPEKGVEQAAEIARRAGLRLRIAAKIETHDRRYLERVVRPLLAEPFVEYVGEISERDKAAFLGGALALVFPIDWPEPFGLVQIEAMACGTPVVAFRRGSVPEVIDEGVTGFVVEDVASAVRAVGRVCELSRAACRRRFEQRFCVERMADRYVAVYRRLIGPRAPSSDRRARPARGRGPCSRKT